MRAYSEICQPGQLRIERQFFDADRPHPLFGNDHFGGIGHVSQAVLPAGISLQERLISLFPPLPRLILAEVIFLPAHKADDIGILLDRARIAQVRQLRAFILARFHVTGELREGQHGDVQVLGDGFEAAGDVRDLDGAVLTGLQGVGAAQELQIVGAQEPDAVLALQAPGPGADRVDRQVGRKPRLLKSFFRGAKLSLSMLRVSKMRKAGTLDFTV
jgi:hypothetical protein